MDRWPLGGEEKGWRWRAYILWVRKGQVSLCAYVCMFLCAWVCVREWRCVNEQCHGGNEAIMVSVCEGRNRLYGVMISCILSVGKEWGGQAGSDDLGRVAKRCWIGRGCCVQILERKYSCTEAAGKGCKRSPGRDCRLFSTFTPAAETVMLMDAGQAGERNVALGNSKNECALICACLCEIPRLDSSLPLSVC